MYLAPFEFSLAKRPLGYWRSVFWVMPPHSHLGGPVPAIQKFWWSCSLLCLPYFTCLYFIYSREININEFSPVIPRTKKIISDRENVEIEGSCETLVVVLWRNSCFEHTKMSALFTRCTTVLLLIILIVSTSTVLQIIIIKYISPNAKCDKNHHRPHAYLIALFLFQ